MNKKIIWKHCDGYIQEYSPKHPACDGFGFVYQHRLVMEKTIGRYLSGKEIIHHINGKKNDNRIENLLLCSDQKEHIRIHNGWIKKK